MRGRVGDGNEQSKLSDSKAYSVTSKMDAGKSDASMLEDQQRGEENKTVDSRFC